MNKNRPVPGLSKGPSQFSQRPSQPIQSPLQPTSFPPLGMIQSQPDPADDMKDLAMEIYCRLVVTSSNTLKSLKESAEYAKLAARIFFESYSND